METGKKKFRKNFWSIWISILLVFLGGAVFAQAPNVVGVVLSDNILSDPDDGSTLTVEVTYDQVMDTGFPPTITFNSDVVVSGELLFAGGVWSGSDKIYTASYTVSDTDTDNSSIDITVENAQNTTSDVQNSYTENNAFDCKFSNPTISSVSVSDANLTVVDLGGTFTITVEFGQAMNTGINPSVSFPVENPTGTITGPSGSWINSTTYEVDYSIGSGNQEVADVDIQVTGGVDANGNNHLLTHNETNEFSIDNKKPSVVSVTPNLSGNISDSDQGASKFTLTIRYDENMDTGIDPTVDFNNENPSTTLAEVSKVWQPDDRTLVVSYDVSDNDVVLAGVDVLVSGGQDVLGNIANDKDDDDKFNIDTSNPTVTLLTENINTIADSDEPSNFTLTIDYNANVASYPTVTFSPAVSSTLTKTGESGINTNQVIYTYSITDVNSLQTGVDVDVTGATAANGNIQNAYNEADVFNINMSDPQVLTITPNLTTVTDDHLGTATFSLTIKYDKNMNTGISPTIATPTAGEDAFATLTQNVASSTWTNSTTYVAYFDVADANELVKDIDVRVTAAKDANNNLQVQKDQVNVFSIDSENPDVVSVTPNLSGNISDSDQGASKFTLTILYNEDMNAGIYPTVDFDNENPSATITEASKVWQPDNRTLIVSYDVSDNNIALAGVDVLVSGGEDVLGNTANNKDDDDKFNIDTSNPTVTLLTESINTIKDNDEPSNFTLTIDYSTNVASYPIVTFSPTVSSTLTKIGESGINTSQVIFTYSITDNHSFQTGIDVDITGATAANGNIQNAYNEIDVFNIDMSNPQVTSIIPNLTTITDSYIGSATFSLTIKFDKDMNTGIAPSIETPTVGEDAFSTLTLNAGSSTWTNSTTYVAYYNVGDVNELVNNIDVRVTAAEDANNNLQIQKDLIDVFSIDTSNPAITGIVANDALISDSDVGTGKFFVTITYDKDMNTSILPSVTFQNPSHALTLGLNSGSWLNARNCKMIYNVLDYAVEVDDVDVYVSGTTAKDPQGNKPAAYTEPDLFNIDTKNPSATGILESVDPIIDSHVGAGTFTLTFNFSEPMKDDGSAPPIINFPIENPSATLSGPSVTWPANNQCVVTYNVFDAGQDITDVDVKIQNVRDAAGNLIPAKTFTNVFNVDMKNPTITNMSIISNNANNTALAKVGDEITVNFGVNMALGALPNATIAGQTATVVSAGGLNYTAKATVGGTFPEGTTAITLDFVDINSNPGSADESDITNGSSVVIDRTAPPADILAADITQFGGTSVTISASDHANNKVWFAPVGQAVETDFATGSTMTKNTHGFSTTILAPANVGTYYIYVIDEAGNVSAESSKKLTVDNNVKLSSMEGTPLTWTEGALAIQITSALLVEDDSDNILSALISISNYDSGDILIFSNTSKITGVWNDVAGELTLTGNATKVEYQAALRSITYKSTSEKPDEASARTINFTVNDGFGDSNVQSRLINVIEVNDPPTINSIAVSVGRQGETYTYEFDVTDVDDNITVAGNITLTTKPTWLSIAPGGSGVAIISGTATQPKRVNPVVITVNDGRGGVDIQSYDIIVSAAIIVNPSGGANFKSLQDALDDPSTLSGDRIELADGTYNENIVFPIGKDIEIIGNTVDPTQVVISGDGNSAVVTFAKTTKTHILKGVTIENGNGKNYNWVAQTLHAPESNFGGGVFIEGASPTLEKCVIKNNKAAHNSATNNGGSGGGMYIGKGANPTITGTIIENNTAEVYRGGGVCIELASATFTGCTIRNNSSGSYGGGVAIFNSTVTFDTVTVENNSVTSDHSEGGGIYLHNSVLIQNSCTVTGNSAVLIGDGIHGYKSTY